MTCGHAGNETTSADKDTAYHRQASTSSDSSFVVKTFSSKTEEYFVKVTLHFLDTTLVEMNLTGNCDMCSFDFSGQPKQTGKTQNVDLSSGIISVSTQYLYYDDINTFIFELWDDDSSPIRLQGMKIKDDQTCEKCFRDIRLGQHITPLRKHD